MKDLVKFRDELSNFYGTEAYYKIGPNAVLTDGTKFVAEQLGAFWLFQDTAIYMAGYQETDGFAVIRLSFEDSGPFKVELGDGNGHWRTLFGSEFTDFPKELVPFEFYACWDAVMGMWVLMLKSEY